VLGAPPTFEITFLAWTISTDWFRTAESLVFARPSTIRGCFSRVLIRLSAVPFGPLVFGVGIPVNIIEIEQLAHHSCLFPRTRFFRNIPNGSRTPSPRVCSYTGSSLFNFPPNYGGISPRTCQPGYFSFLRRQRPRDPSRAFDSASSPSLLPRSAPLADYINE